MVRSLKHRRRPANWSLGSERYSRNDAFPDFMLEVFNEQGGRPTDFNWEGISIESFPVIGQDLPAILWMAAKLKKVRTDQLTPTDPPVRGSATHSIKISAEGQ